jgi:signal transduction histidine kinase
METAAPRIESHGTTHSRPHGVNRVILVGIESEELTVALQAGGYRIVSVDDPSCLLNITPPFAAMVIAQKHMRALRAETIERLYFQNDSVPIAVVLSDVEAGDAMLMHALREGTLEALWESDIAGGLAVARIDRMIMADRLDRHLRTLQQALSEKRLLEQELSIRDQTLTRERGINANILASITSGLIVLDTAGTVILVNEHVPRLLRDTGDILGTSYTTALPSCITAIAARLIENDAEGQRSSAMGKCKIGELYLEVSAYRMLDYRNLPTGILLLLQDVTEYEHMNLQLYRAEKLATMGTMLSGIAHELRNPLSIISARAQRALTKKDGDAAWMRKCFASIETQTERCASIVNNLLDFTRNTATTPGFHDIGDIIDETLTYVEYQNLFDDITVEKHYQPDAQVYGDRSRYVQVFLNLITNAADAMAGRGTLAITTEKAGPLSTLVNVSDTGPGIARAIHEQIFDPFFTTKEPGKGTGLGLAIVYKIVQESGGRIWFGSRPGHTTFSVMLPSVKERVHEGAHTAG